MKNITLEIEKWNNGNSYSIYINDKYVENLSYTKLLKIIKEQIKML